MYVCVLSVLLFLTVIAVVTVTKGQAWGQTLCEPHLQTCILSRAQQGDKKKSVCIEVYEKMTLLLN